MPQRSVATNYTFEQQRSEINLLAADFWSQKATVDGASSTYLKHDGSNDFTGGTLAVPNAFTINSNGGQGTLTISGNLTVTGTTTTVNTANLEVTDKNILIAKGSTSDANSDGAGITIDSGTDITWNFVNANDAWVSSIGVQATTFLKGPYGQFTGSGTPATGMGVEVNAPDANTGQITSYDRTNSAYKDLRIKGSSIGVYTGTTNAIVGTFNSTGLTIEKNLVINGGAAASNALLVSGNYNGGNPTVDIQTWQRIGGAVQAKMIYKDATTDLHFGTDTAHNFSLMTGGSDRIKIASNSAATSIGGAMTFNAMLTVQGDVSGSLFSLKAAEDTDRFNVSGLDTSDVEVNLYDKDGTQRGILVGGSTEFAIKAPSNAAPLTFYTHNGTSIGERLRIHSDGGTKFTRLTSGGAETVGNDPGKWFKIGTWAGSTVDAAARATITVIGAATHDQNSNVSGETKIHLAFSSNPTLYGYFYSTTAVREGVAGVAHKYDSGAKSAEIWIKYAEGYSSTACNADVTNGFFTGENTNTGSTSTPSGATLLDSWWNIRTSDGTNSLERLSISNSGNVTVKTNDVALSGSGILRINSGSTTGALNLDGGASNHGGEINLLGGSNGGRIIFRTGQGAGQQGEKMRLDENGNLHISSAATCRIVLGNAGGAAGSLTNNENWIRGSATMLQLNTAGGDYGFEVLGSQKMKLDSSGNIELRSATQNRITFGSNGSTGNDTNWVRGDGDNLMFNCITNHKWEVNGNGHLELNSARLKTVDAHLHIMSSGNTPTLEFQGAGSNKVGEINADAISGTTSQMRFYTETGGSLTEKLTIGSDGVVEVKEHIFMGKASDPKLYSGAGVGFNIDGGALYLNRNVQSSIELAWGGGPVNMTNTADADVQLNIYKQSGADTNQAILRIGYDANNNYSISRVRNQSKIICDSNQGGGYVYHRTESKDTAILTPTQVFATAKHSSKVTNYSGINTAHWGDESVKRFYASYYTGVNSATYHVARMISQTDWGFGNLEIKVAKYQYSPNSDDLHTKQFTTYYGGHSSRISNYNQQSSGGGTGAWNVLNWRQDFGPGGALQVHDSSNGGYYRNCYGSDIYLSLGVYTGIRLEFTVWASSGTYDCGNYATASDFYPAAFGGTASQTDADNWNGPRGTWFNSAPNGTGQGTNYGLMEFSTGSVYGEAQM